MKAKRVRARGCPAPRPGRRAGRTPGPEKSRRALFGVHVPRLLGELNEPGLRAPAAMLHSRRAPVIWRSRGKQIPQHDSPLAFRGAQLRTRPEGNAEDGRELEPCGRRSPRGHSAAAASLRHLPSRGCGAERSAEARLPVATTRRRFAARAAAANAGTAACSYTSGSSICKPKGGPRGHLSPLPRVLIP